jgi:hypothetical protein
MGENKMINKLQQLADKYPDLIYDNNFEHFIESAKGLLLYQDSDTQYYGLDYIDWRDDCLYEIAECDDLDTMLYIVKYIMDLRQMEFRVENKIKDKIYI